MFVQIRVGIVLWLARHGSAAPAQLHWIDGPMSSTPISFNGGVEHTSFSKTTHLPSSGVKINSYEISMHERLAEAGMTRQASQKIWGQKSKSKNEKICKHRKLLESPEEDRGIPGKFKDSIHLSTKQKFYVVDVPDHLAPSPEVVQVPGTIGGWNRVQKPSGSQPQPKRQEVVEGVPPPQQVVPPFQKEEDVARKRKHERTKKKLTILFSAIGGTVALAAMTGVVAWWHLAKSSKEGLYRKVRKWRT